MSSIFGGEDPKCTPVPVWFCVLVAAMTFVLLVLVFLIYSDLKDGVITKSGFENLYDFGIKQKGDQIVQVASVDETSLRQVMDERIARGKANATSQLTGTRDIPVFFQDYDVEAGRASATSAVNTAREGFEGGRADDELERALAGRN